MNRLKTQEEPIAGRLEGTAVPALIRELGRRHATGKLHVEGGGIKRSLFIENGRVTFAASSDPNTRLGEHLLRESKISLRQLESALTAQGSGERLGTLLVHAGVLTEGQLVEAVVDQIAAIVLDVLTWSSGSYHFEPGPPAEEDILLGLSTEQLIYRSVQAISSPSLVESGLGTPRAVYRLTDDWGKQAEMLDLCESARALIDRLTEGPASIETLCRDVCISNFEVCRTLWAFKLLGVVEPSERDAAGETEGSLREVDLATLMLDLERQGATGMLFLAKDRVERSLLFAAGRCVFATSSNPDDGLVNYLFRRGVISLRDKEETARRLLSNKRVGTILRELGAIDDEDLQQMVRDQVSEIVYDTFRWEDGEYVFVPGSLPHAEEITLNCGVRALIAGGTRRVISWTRVVRGCGGIDNPLCLSPDYLEVLDDIGAGVAEWEVVNALKSPQTPRRICAATDLNDYRVCQILWTLKLLGAIEDSPVEVDEEALAAVDPAAAALTSPSGDPVGETDEPEGEAVRTAEPVLEEEAVDLTVEPPPTADEQPIGSPQAADTAREPEGVEPSGAEPAEGPSEVPEPEADVDRPIEVEQVLQSLDEQQRDSAPEIPSPADEEAEVRASADEPASPPPAKVPSWRPQTGNGPAAEPEWDVPQDVEEVILRFNAMHRVVYRAVRTEVGAGAANFVQSCSARVSEQHPDPVEGVQLYADGSWDLDGLMRVIVEKGIDHPWEVYQALLEEEFVTLQPHLGDARADALRERIWEIERCAE